MSSPDPAGPVDDREFGTAWSELVREIESCRRCPLGAGREHVVVYRGSRHPSVVFVGEAPGREEDRTGIPFVGRSGKRLDRAIERLGLPPEGVGVLNLVKCRPPENRLPTVALASCRPFLERQLQLLAPARLVTLGRHALRAMDPSSPPVSQAAGRPRDRGRIPFFPLLHPAAALRSRRWARRWDRDVGRLARWLGRSDRQPS